MGNAPVGGPVTPVPKDADPATKQTRSSSAAALSDNNEALPEPTMAQAASTPASSDTAMAQATAPGSTPAITDTTMTQATAPASTPAIITVSPTDNPAAGGAGEEQEVDKAPTGRFWHVGCL
jgi:hypothetical protein